MFRDTRKELERLESALLKEDAPDLSGECKTYCQGLPRGFNAYNSDRTDEDPQVYSRALLHPPKKRRRSVLLIVLSLCAVAAYWLLRLWGSL
jgi:hypothetical protein